MKISIIQDCFWCLKKVDPKICTKTLKTKPDKQTNKQKAYFILFIYLFLMKKKERKKRRKKLGDNNKCTKIWSVSSLRLILWGYFLS